MVLQYLPLARSMAYRATSLPFEDAVQEAIIGLIRAADRFDESRGTAFSTYARYWITDALQRAAIQALPVHVPIHVAKASLAKARRSLADGSPAGGMPANDCPANDGDAHAQSCDKSPAGGKRNSRTGDRRISHAFAATNIQAERVELEHEDGEPRHGDRLTQNPWTEIENNIDADTVKAYFQRLTIRQKHALMLHFGIGGTDGCTLEEAGSIMGISREGVRQLIVRGLEELRGLLQAS